MKALIEKLGSVLASLKGLLAVNIIIITITGQGASDSTVTDKEVLV